jgi:hypothetical protein
MRHPSGDRSACGCSAARDEPLHEPLHEPPHEPLHERLHEPLHEPPHEPLHEPHASGPLQALTHPREQPARVFADVANR